MADRKSDPLPDSLMTEDEMRCAIRRAYEQGDHGRKLMLMDGSYLTEADVRELCFTLGDYSENPSIFRSLPGASHEHLTKALEFCQSKGFGHEA